MRAITQIVACLPRGLGLSRQILHGILTYRPSGCHWRISVADLGSLKAVRWKSVDGIVGFFASKALLGAVPWQMIPTVNTSSQLACLPVTSVLPDNAAIGAMAAQHLSGLGLSRLLCVMTRSSTFAVERWRGFEAAARKEGAIVSCTEDRRLSAHLRKAKEPIGLFAVTDENAAKLARLCEALDLSVPQRVAILGVDNDPIACAASPVPISSIDPNGIQVGYLAVQELEALLLGRRVEHTTLVPPLGVVVVRESTDVLAIDDPVVAYAVRYIRGHAMGRMKVGDICQGLTVSRRTLEKRFSKHINLSLHRYIVHTRLESARALLATTDVAVHDVAHRCGFTYLPRFMTLFKRVYGLTPGEHRRQFQLR